MYKLHKQMYKLHKQMYKLQKQMYKLHKQMYKQLQLHKHLLKHQENQLYKLLLKLKYYQLKNNKQDLPQFFLQILLMEKKPSKKPCAKVLL